MEKDNIHEIDFADRSGGKRARNRVKNRFTTLVRLDRRLKDAVKLESERTGEPISKLMDFAVGEYLDSVKAID